MGLEVHQALELLHAARSAAGAAERRFVLLNATREHLPYHVAVLWEEAALRGHSGASQVDPQGPYGQWLASLVPAVLARQARRLQAADLPEPLAAGWSEWWPPHLLVLHGQREGDALLLVREVPWSEQEDRWLAQWWELWQLADRAARADAPRSAIDFRLLARRARSGWFGRRSRRRWAMAAALALVLLFPVRLTVRAPGELVPREPTVLRASVDGMAQKLHAEPNQAVRSGQLLAVLDDAAAASRLQVARQALATAEAEWRQTVQQALTDSKAKAQLAVMQGRVEEKRTEVAYLGEQMRRTEVRAPHDGVVLIEDPGNWAGRTVAAGEPLMRLARPDDLEVEAWLPVADAVELPLGSPVRLFLSSRPASPVHATLRLYAYEPLARPDGSLAYRLRAQLAAATRERLGARGTAHVEGARVPFVYWVLRRPLAALRETTGW